MFFFQVTAIPMLSPVLEQLHKMPGNDKSFICKLAYFLKNLDLYPDFF